MKQMFERMRMKDKHETSSYSSAQETARGANHHRNHNGDYSRHQENKTFYSEYHQNCYQKTQNHHSHNKNKNKGKRNFCSGLEPPGEKKLPPPNIS